MPRLVPRPVKCGPFLHIEFREICCSEPIGAGMSAGVHGHPNSAVSNGSNLTEPNVLQLRKEHTTIAKPTFTNPPLDPSDSYGPFIADFFSASRLKQHSRKGCSVSFTTSPDSLARSDSETSFRQAPYRYRP